MSAFPPPPPVIERSPVGIAAVQHTDHTYAETVAVCDDGSCWLMHTGGWEAYAPIPGTRAAIAAAGAAVAGDELVEAIVAELSRRFRTFGGGRDGGGFNPLADALKDQAVTFAAGVDAAEVVRFILSRAKGRAS